MFIRLQAWWSCRRLRREHRAFFTSTPGERRLMLRIFYWDWRKLGMAHDEALLWAGRQWRWKVRMDREWLETKGMCDDLIQLLDSVTLNGPDEES